MQALRRGHLQVRLVLGKVSRAKNELVGHPSLLGKAMERLETKGTKHIPMAW